MIQYNDYNNKMSDENINIWVVTVNWNQPEYTKECIKSLRKRNNLKFQVVIVDNGSTNNSKTSLKSIDSINIIQNEINLGFSGGFNAGLKFAIAHKPDYIFMVNNDTISDFNMLDLLVSSAQKLDADISAPAIYYSHAPEKIWSTGGNINRLLSAPIDCHNQKKPLPQNPIRRDFLTGCALLIKKDVFDKLGFFDETFFLYYEDLDFFKRAFDANLSVWLIPSAKIFHHVSGSIQNLGTKVQHYWTGNSSWRYFLKHIKPWQWIFVFPWRAGHTLKKWLKLAISGNFSSAKAYVNGSVDGIKAFLQKP